MKLSMKKVEFVFLFMVVFVENSFWLRIEYPAKYRYAILVVATTIFILFKVKENNKIEMKKKKLSIFLSLSSLITISSAIHGEINEFYFASIIGIFIAFIIANFISLNRVIENYTNIMLVICIFSFITLIISYILPDIIRLFPEVNNIHTGEERNLGLNVINISDQYRRNKGVFAEHGMFSCYIVVALIFQFYNYKKSSNKKIYIFLITLISTMSTVGAIASIITVISLLTLNRNNYLGKKMKIILIITIIILIYIYPYLPDGYKLLFNKFQEGVNKGSFAERVSSLEVSISGFINSPLIGSSRAYIEKLSSETISNIMTVTIMNWFAYYGVFVGIICNVGIVKFCFNITKNRGLKIVSVAILIIAIVTQNMMSSIIINMLIYYSVEKIEVKS